MNYITLIVDNIGEDIADMILEKVIPRRRLGDIFKFCKDDNKDFIIVNDQVMSFEYYKKVYVRRFFL